MSSNFIYLPPSGSAGVSSLNTLIGDITLAAGTNITLGTVGNTITINSSGGGSPTAPTQQVFTSGSGTYTTPTSPSPLYIEVIMVGGGAGGSGYIVVDEYYQ